MSQKIELGKIRPFPLRQLWPHEQHDLSSWMAAPENLLKLGAALGIGELTLEGKPEFAIGTEHYVDIVARNAWNERVAIENQFGKSDPDHLGRGIVYLSNIGASTLIWVAEKLRDPHRTTLAWLNENTPEGFGFFGVEIEALTIDDSRPAVRFNVVVRPNNWQRRASRQSGDGPLTAGQIWLQRYWTSFAEFLEASGALDWSRELPRDRYWGGEVGRPGFRIFGIVNRKEQLLEVQLDVRHSELERIIGALEAQRSEIEADIDCPLEWRRKPQSLQVATRTRDLDPNDETKWRSQHEWMLGWMQSFRSVFRNRIAEIVAAHLATRSAGVTLASGDAAVPATFQEAP